MTDRIADRGLVNDPVYITDLSAVEPADAVGPVPAFHRWRSMAYTAGELSGRMLLAGPETAAPDVTLDLNASGWHAVTLGLMPPPGYEGAPLKVLARLSGDATPTMLTAQPAHPEIGHDLQLVELYWRTADLTGRQLVLGQPQWQTAPVDAVGAWRSEIVRIAYVKLVPLTDAEVAEAQAERRRTDTRRLFAHQDAHGPHYLWRLNDAEGIRREIEPYRDSDFSRMYWEAGEGDISYYFSKIARWCTFDEAEDFARVGDRLHAESWREFRDLGVDPLDVAIEHCHDAGLEIHASYRVAGFWYPPPIDHFNLGDTFAAAHPEWRGRDRNGQTTPRIAYSYPEVRAYIVSLLREMAERPIDGVCLLYNRRLPLVEYEPPVVAAFQDEYGLDPHALPADDDRWLRFRARELTQFVREVRQAMDEMGAVHGKRLGVSAVVMSSEQENLQNAIDLGAWVEEGIVDTLIPYTSVPGGDSHAVSWEDPADLAYFVELVRGTDCVLAPGMMPRHRPPEDVRRQAAGIYGAGADHLFFWDAAGGSGRANHGAMWNALRRLGHRDEIEAWRAAGEPSLQPTAHDVDVLDDWDLSYTTPG
ncbi:MAG: family 10 glycosylhydrolase [Chloroflexi bacterium]|nr:family 10 glycosylhydrolase [Chloroflexota bacterium]